MTSSKVLAVVLSLCVGSAFAATTVDKNMANNSPKLDKMDYGPFLSNTIEANYPSAKNFTIKGIAIRLGEKKDAAVCFDTDTMRYSVAWIGGFVNMNIPKDGIAGIPSIKGTPLWGTHGSSIGWAKDGSFKDPRQAHGTNPPRGPLPADWAKYKGLYLNGQKVTLSYSVGGVGVLEELTYSDFSHKTFGREVSIEPSTVEMTHLILEEPESASLGDPGEQSVIIDMDHDKNVKRLANKGETKEPLLSQHHLCVNLAQAPKDLALKVDGKRLLLVIPPHEKTVHFLLYISYFDNGSIGGAGRADGGFPRLERLNSGGAPRYTKVLETKGELSKDTTSAYVVDTVGIPFENPWDAYMRIGAFDFFKDGRVAICTISGDVWIVSGIDAKLEKQTWRRFATGLFVPMGLKIVDDKIYVAGRDQITRLHDLNNDGEADYYENFNNDCEMGTHYQEYAMDLETDSKGNFYLVRGAFLGASDSIHEGTLMRFSPDGKKSEIYAIGLRAANGLAISPTGEIVTSDNQGNWTPSTPINIIKQGGFYGFKLENHPETLKMKRPNPLCWIPYDLDTSGGGQVWAGPNWGPLSNRLLHTSYGKSKLFAVLTEKYKDLVQGGVIKFPLEFASGIMRARVSPVDGQVYVAGLRGWQTNGVKDGALQRVRYTGKPYNSVVNIQTTSSGLILTFAATLDAESAQDNSNWTCERFNVKYSSTYGSAEFSLEGSDKKGRDPVEVKSSKLDASGKILTMELESMKLCTNLVVKYRLKSKDGTALAQELDYTVNFIPGGSVSTEMEQSETKTKTTKK